MIKNVLSRTKKKSVLPLDYALQINAFKYNSYHCSLDISNLNICIHHNVCQRNLAYMSKHSTEIHLNPCHLHCMAYNLDSRRNRLNKMHNEGLDTQVCIHTFRFLLCNFHWRKMRHSHRLSFNDEYQKKIEFWLKLIDINNEQWFAQLTLTNIRIVHKLSIWSIVSRFAFVAIDSGGVVLAILAHTSAFVLTMNI